MSETASRFAADKARVLGQVDLSRKGSVDAAIAPLLVYINAQDCYYSTSSCAGRLIAFAEVEPVPPRAALSGTLTVM